MRLGDLADALSRRSVTLPQKRLDAADRAPYAGSRWTGRPGWANRGAKVTQQVTFAPKKGSAVIPRNHAWRLCG
jgi:hypothetical protein